MARVLLVEDSPTQAMQIRLLLEQLTYEVASCMDGKSALEILRTHPIDVVLTDLELPEMNGLQLVESMRKDYPLIPAILITGKGSEELAYEALRRGAAAYVPKSRMGDMLRETLQNVLGALRTDESFAALIDCLEENEYRFTLPSEPALIRPLTNLVTQITAGMRLFAGSETVRLAMAMHHGLLNAMYRGNLEISRAMVDMKDNEILSGQEPEIALQRRETSPYKDRRVQVAASVNRAEVRVRIRDEGPGFDTSIVPAAADPETLAREGGRGLLIMSSFMDGLAFNKLGNEVTMIKLAKS